MPPRLFLERPEKGGFHNLCNKLIPPEGSHGLLRLGLKYCIERGRPNQKITDGIFCLRRSVRLKDWLQKQDPFREENDSDDNDIDINLNYNPKLYIQSDFEPPCIEDGPAESAMMKFAEGMFKVEKSTKHSKCFNLTTYQHMVLKELKADQLIKNRHRRKVASDTEFALRDLIEEHYDDLAPWEQDYFNRSYDLEHWMPQFYLTAKVHKKPWSTRPVVSCVGSFNEIFSKWIDDKMKLLLPVTTTYLRDSNQVLEEIRSLGSLPTGAKLFTADAVSMYTNIHPDHGLEVFAMWFDKFKPEIPDGFPRNLFLECLRLIMENNLFQFDDTFWHQHYGMALGTSASCMYATLYYAYHECTVLLEK
eukprot:scaffold75400_cov53-Attheya_sp.AAC.1